MKIEQKYARLERTEYTFDWYDVIEALRAKHKINSKEGEKQEWDWEEPDGAINGIVVTLKVTYERQDTQP